MIEFDIDELREEIEDLSYEEKLEFLEDKESDFESEKEELESRLEELEDCISEINSLKEEIQIERCNTICNGILQSLKAAGYSLELNGEGNLSFSLGAANITLPMSFVEPKVNLFFTADKKQLKYQELIASLLPDFKQDVNFFTRQVAEDELGTCVVDAVKKLMDHEREFEEIGGEESS